MTTSSIQSTVTVASISRFFMRKWYEIVAHHNDISAAAENQKYMQALSDESVYVARATLARAKAREFL